MEQITEEYIKNIFGKRNYEFLKKKKITFSKEELLSSLKEIDYEKLTKALANSNNSYKEIEAYAKLSAVFLMCTPAIEEKEYKCFFSKKECIDLVKDFFMQENPTFAIEFNNRINDEKKIYLNENAPNLYNSKDDIVSVKMFDNNNTMANIFTLMHESTHSLSLSSEKPNKLYKLNELPTIANEYNFLRYIISKENIPIEAKIDAINYLLYHISDTRFMAIFPIIENDLINIYNNNGRINYPIMEEYAKKLEAESFKGIFFLESGSELLKGIIKNYEMNKKPLYTEKKGNYVIGELMGSKLFNKDNFQSKITNLCEIMRGKQSGLNELGITCMNESFDIRISDNELPDITYNYCTTLKNILESKLVIGKNNKLISEEEKNRIKLLINNLTQIITNIELDYNKDNQHTPANGI